MHHHRRWAALRHLAAPALALAVIAAIPLGRPAAAPPARESLGLAPVTVSYSRPASFVKGQFLSYNDFHGAIDPTPSGSGAVVNGTPAGGVEFLATWLKRLRAEGKADGRKTLTVGAGDLIGATPLVSAAFHDEPTIELMNEVGLQVSSVGNHEFDEGVDELLRMQRGGCHPTDGCQDGDGFGGAKFHYLAANTISKRTGRPILPAIDVKLVGGVPVGFVGLTLEGTPGIVNPAGIRNVTFADEIETANKWGNKLKRLGVKAQVLLVHEGGGQSTTADPSGCAGFTGPIVPIVAGLNPEFGLVVSGHTHRFYSCALPNRSGAQSVVTSAGSNGQLITDVDYTVDKRTRRFAQITAKNVIVENGVRNADGSWQVENGVFVRNPALIDARAKKVADKYRTAVAPIANRVVGSITADITRDPVASGEFPLGDVIADAQLAYTTTSAGAQIALMNPGGVRANLTYAPGPGQQPGQVTYGEAFTVQPFNNLVVTQTFTGAQIKNVLEQQFAGFGGQTVQRILQPSAGFTYTYSASAAPGSKVSGIALGGTPIDPAASYQVTTNDFLANGGDGFTNLSQGTGRVTAPGFDVDALTAYLGAGAPVAPGPANRITRVS